ncbi:hypothetical protein C4D60_Mb03t01360 [Musa balbisiana]|uniref:Uncharacterized protein n=1 Tax=Musa balbisiana TaxID=52838 RepID=A0A4S8J6R2_MUSBA|nr:hypothetical protein C4D60_Mb03t01360 [Musa balbisiana]
MWEDRPHLISRTFESTSDQESNWHHLPHHFHELSNGKKRVVDEGLGEEEEEEEEEREGRGKRKKKSLQQPDILDLEEMKRPLGDNSDGHRSDGESNNFNRLHRDAKISCLVHLSRSYYGVVASVNRDFRTMIRSGEIHMVRWKVSTLTSQPRTFEQQDLRILRTKYNVQQAAPWVVTMTMPVRFLCVAVGLSLHQ